MIDLNEVAVFTMVADAGSFSAAAKLLGLPRSTVSRKVSRLEDDLGVRLLQRTTRKLSLTDAGREYYLQCNDALVQITQASERITQAQQMPSGVLRIAAPLASQRGFMSEWILEFLLEYKAVSVEVSLSDDIVDLIEERIDVAFRAGKLEDSSLIARRLGYTRMALCASADYLQTMPPINNLKDLQVHSGILFGVGGDIKGWRLGRGKRMQLVKMNNRIVVNSMEFVLNSCLKGLGVALLPIPMITEYIDDGRLMLVLEEYANEADGLYAVYPSRRHLSAAARAFLEFISKKAEAGLPWDRLLV